MMALGHNFDCQCVCNVGGGEGGRVVSGKRAVV